MLSTDAMLTIGDPKLRFLYDYWSKKRLARRFPSRADLDPVEMRRIIGNVSLIDVIAGDPPRFRIRLQGTNIVHRLGVAWDKKMHDVTGRMLDELPASEFRILVRQAFARVATTGEPLHARRDEILDGQPYRYETIVLPLSRNGTAVDMLLTGMVYANEQSSQGADGSKDGDSSP